jgi:hypothetical protein
MFIVLPLTQILFTKLINTDDMMGVNILDAQTVLTLNGTW